MTNYYFVSSLLPPLKVGAPPEMGSRELDFFLRHNLTKADFAKVVALRRLIDIENIQFIWRKEPIQEGGNLTELELEESLIFKEGFPSYVIEFLEVHTSLKDRLKYFPQLLYLFFENEISEQTGFLQDYFRFEWQWRLVFVALRAKELGRDLASELQYANQEDPFVASLIAQKDSRTLELEEPYSDLKKIFELKKQSPLDLYQAISEWRFNYIEQIIEWEVFSMERILGYITQLDIIEQWLTQDKRKGIEVVDQIIEKSQAGNI